MLRAALLAVSTEASGFSVMGNQHCRRREQILTHRVISAEQSKSVSLLARRKSIARWTDGDAGNGNGRKRRLPCNRTDRGCVASWGQDHLAGNGADFLLVLSSRTLEEPMHEAKQMTMA